ncbi:lytic transglycosylase domain-containing protein [Rubrivirga sp.]|uniref:lytic transglycosylase domain-containing protein n=1 Tax=Rubrivirga sp. TaxID=1885344 RepID=UPI003B51DB0D
MPTLRAAAAVLLALAAAGPPVQARTAATDSTEAAAGDPLAWARAVVQARRAVEAAEAEADPDRKAALATEAVRAVDALETGGASQASVRALGLRAQAVYEAVFGAVATGPLAPDEWGALRGPALAALGPNFAPPLVDPVAVAAQRAEAERAAGPAALFYPADAVAHVEAQRAAAARLARAGRRGRRTLGRIERVLLRRGLPAELQYVAVIESALNPQAESWAGAEGLWQFMPATAEEFGLDSLTVHQEGPSTEAAARYLRWLGRRFGGDWHLALAAYNCGVGRVEGVVREVRAEIGREPTFWDVRERLPRETQHYVPRFLAVAEALGARS